MTFTDLPMHFIDFPKSQAVHVDVYFVWPSCHLRAQMYPHQQLGARDTHGGTGLREKEVWEGGMWMPLSEMIPASHVSARSSASSGAAARRAQVDQVTQFADDSPARRLCHCSLAGFVYEVAMVSDVILVVGLRTRTSLLQQTWPLSLPSAPGDDRGDQPSHLKWHHFLAEGRKLKPALEMANVTTETC